jgi:hypothetical protein
MWWEIERKCRPVVWGLAGKENTQLGLKEPLFYLIVTGTQVNTFHKHFKKKFIIFRVEAPCNSVDITNVLQKLHVSIALEMMAASSSETSGNIYTITRYSIRGNITVHNPRLQGLKHHDVFKRCQLKAHAITARGKEGRGMLVPLNNGAGPPETCKY